MVVSGNTTHDSVLPAAPTATAATFAGDGVNADTVAAVPAALGSSWTAPLLIAAMAAAIDADRTTELHRALDAVVEAWVVALRP